MIPAIFKTPVEVKHVHRLPENNLTDATIQKVVLGILATISFSISYLAFTVGGAALLLAIPTLVIGATLIWTITRIKDYQDAKKLEQYQAEAAKVPLDQTIKSHGWKNMFLYDIPKKGAFDIRYRDYVKDMSMRDIISLYEDANKVRDTLIKQKIEPSLVLLEPAKFIRNWDAEVQNLTPILMFKLYDLEKLYEHNIIPKALLEAKENYNAALADTAKRKEEIDAWYWTEYRARNDHFSQELERSVDGPRPDRQRFKSAMEALGKERETHLNLLNQEFTKFCEDLNQRFA